jgi:hypothetical protein
MGQNLQKTPVSLALPVLCGILEFRTQKNGPYVDQLSLGNSASRGVAFAPLRNFLARCDQKTKF